MFWSGLVKVWMLWHLKRTVHTRKPSTVAILKQLCKQKWTNIFPQHCDTLLSGYWKCVVAATD